MNATDLAVSIALILLLCGFLGALGCVIADWRRYLRWVRKHWRWQKVTKAWEMWAR